MTTEMENINLKEYLEQEGISHDDIINEEIEQEHKETETIELSEEKVLANRINASQKAKKEQFLKEMKENPNKRLYSSKIVIEFAELIEIDKESLRYEENAEDYQFNNDLMKSKTTDFVLALMHFVSNIQNTKNVSVENLEYCGRPYQAKMTPKINFQSINLNNVPKEVQEALKNIAKTISSCECCDDSENCED